MTGRRTTLDLAVAGASFVLPLAYSPTLQSGFWSPKAAVLLVIAGGGLGSLVTLLVSRDRGAWVGMAFVTVAAVSSATADRPLQSLLGLYGWGTGVVFWLACLSVWAIGRRVTNSGVSLLTHALVGTAAMSSLVGILQVVVDLSFIDLEPYAGRGYGLLGNPIHLGGLCAAAIGLLAWAWPGRSSWRLVPVVALVAAGLQASGTRIALLAAVAVVLWAVARSGFQRSTPTLFLGLALGLGLATVLPDVPGTANAFERASEGSTSGSLTPRLETWLSARHAIAQDPALGAGPGRFRAATSPHRTLAMEQAEGPDRIFVDAHNVVVELAVTTGLLGLVAFLAWLASMRPGTHRPLAGFAVALGLTALVQPLTVGLAPLAFLALGASATRSREPAPRRALIAVSTMVGVTAAVPLAVILLLGDYAAREASLDFELDDAARAERLLPSWPQQATIVAKVQLYRSILAAPDDPVLLQEAVNWRREAVARDPSAPSLHNELGELLLAVPDLDGAEAAFGEALERDPQSFRAALGLGYTAQERGDARAAARWGRYATRRATSASERRAAARLTP